MLRNWFMASILSGVVLVAAPAVAQISFSQPATVAASVEPGASVAIDADGDGDLDLAVTVDTIDRVSIYLNDGVGNFGAPFDIPTGAGTSPEHLTAVDVEGDGDVDLVVTLKNVNQLLVILNNGGSFVLGASVAVGLEPNHVVAADLDNDGDPDFATANRDGNNLSVVMNNGGVLAPAGNVGVGLEPRQVAAGDFDGDGDIDLAASDHDSRTVTVLSNNGLGTFALSTTLSVGAQIRPEGLVAADLNNDSNVDLVAATSGNGFNFVTVFSGNGAGGFSGPVNYAVGALDPGALAVADLDSDGWLDVVTANKDSNNASVLANNGGGALALVTTLSAGLAPEAVAAADWSGDGKPDVAITNRDSGSVSVYVNQSSGSNLSTLLRGDANDDGSLSLPDAVVMLSALFLSGALPNCVDAADINDDGAFNLSDVVLLLNHLFVPGSSQPAPPFPGCGEDPTADTLECQTSSCP